MATIPVAYARRPVSEASDQPDRREQHGPQQARRRRPGISALVCAQTAEPPLADAIVPTYSEQQRDLDQDQAGHGQREVLGQRVVAAPQRPGEVQRQDVAAQVPGDQLGRLGRDEDR